MADDSQTNFNPNRTMLVAYATANLADGSSFQLLPFVDESDVKNKFNSLIENWSKSGFLLRGERIYPWHQVRSVEVNRVEEMPAAAAYQCVLDWEIAEFSKQQHNFWRTKKQAEGEADKDSSKKEGPKH